MNKSAYYFSHDYQPTSDPKMSAMLSVFHGYGYGCFWRIAEMLHVDPSHKLPLKKHIYMGIARDMGGTHDDVGAFIAECIQDYELFETDGDFFWSNRVLRNIEAQDEIKQKRSEAGKASAMAKATAKSKVSSTAVKHNSTLVQQSSTHVEQVLTGVQQNPTKESKVKESKEKESKGLNDYYYSINHRTILRLTMPL